MQLKASVFYQSSKLVVMPPMPSYIRIDNENFVRCKNFGNLGSIISDSIKHDKTMGKASGAFGRLQNKLWNNHYVSVEVKCWVYRAVVLSALLYGSET